MTTTLHNPATISANGIEPAPAVPSSRGSSPSKPRRVSAALRSEWIKLTTIRFPRAILALTVLVGGLASFMVARFVTDQVVTVANVFGFSAVFTAVFAAVSGILIYTGEAEHHTTQHTFAAEPRRSIVIAAKTVTTSVYTAVLCLSGLAAGAAGAALGGVEMGDTSTIPTTVAWATGFAVLAGVLGLGIGLIARHSAAAISGLLVWWLVVENLVAAFAPDRIVRLMPFTAGNAMLDITNEEGLVVFDRPITALIFAGYALSALLIGALITGRTDP